MDEVTAAERASDKWRGRSGGGLDNTGVADVAEDVVVAETAEREFEPVRMGGELCDPRVRQGLRYKWNSG